MSETKTRYLIAKNPWSAKQILKQVRGGRLQEDRVLYKTDDQAYRRLEGFDRARRHKYSVYKVTY